MATTKLILTDKQLRNFISKVEFFASDVCWNWSGAKNKKGYGHFGLNGKIEKAHRIAYRLVHGTIPKNSLICHKCDNPSCVNPAHLFTGDGFTNQQDASKKKRLFNQKKTHCTKGHLYDSSNTMIKKSSPNKRRCRICELQYSRDWKERNLRRMRS